MRVKATKPLLNIIAGRSRAGPVQLGFNDLHTIMIFFLEFCILFLMAWLCFRHILQRVSR
jgi:hypothetical protein